MQSPTVYVKVDPGPQRDYAVLLLQTKTVYDGLLSEKQRKLTEGILQKKALYDTKCAEISEQQGQETALEYGVKAQDALLKQQDWCNGQLEALRKDYQQKLDKMHQQLDEKWREKQMSATAGVHCKK